MKKKLIKTLFECDDITDLCLKNYNIRECDSSYVSPLLYILQHSDGIKMSQEQFDYIVMNSDIGYKYGDHTTALMHCFMHENKQLPLSQKSFDHIFNSSNLMDMNKYEETILYFFLNFGDYLSQYIKSHHIDKIVHHSISEEIQQTNTNYFLKNMDFINQYAGIEKVWPYIDDKKWFVNFVKANSKPQSYKDDYLHIVKNPVFIAFEEKSHLGQHININKNNVSLNKI